MTIMMMVERGNALWQCDECDMVTFDYDEFAYGHDCEAD